MKTVWALAVVGFVQILTACSQAPTANNNNNNQNPNGNSNIAVILQYLGDSGIKSFANRVHARASWQDFGISVRQGDRIYIRSTGSWSGGQMKFGSSTGNSSVLSCDAAGCNGDKALVYNVDEDFEFDEITLQSGNNATTTIHHIYYTINNIERNEGSDMSEIMSGFAGGRLDDETVCFSSNNVLLGANTSNLETDGHWRNRRVYWQGLANSHSGNSTLHPLFVNLVNLYKNSTCDDPVTEVEIENALQALRNANYFWPGTEVVYDPVYLVEVPSNNYKETCNSEGDIIVSYLYGKPNSVITKNECAKTNRNALIMKIVSNTEDLTDVAPIIVKKDYESTAYIVQKTGRLYFRNNDLDSGIFDNSGFLNVVVSLQ